MGAHVVEEEAAAGKGSASLRERELRWWRKKRQRRRGVQAEVWRNACPVNIFRSKPGSTTHLSSMKYGLNYHDSNQIRVEQPQDNMSSRSAFGELKKMLSG